MPKKNTKKKKIERIVKLIADKKLDEALELADIDNVEDLLSIGVLFGGNKVHDVAEKIFDRIIQLNPNYAESWSNKGIALGNLGKYDEAIKCYDKAIKINLNYDKAWYNKGVVLGDLGKYNEAIKCYDKAIKINPNYDKAWYNKGVALGDIGKYNEAIKCYDKAIKINPNDAESWSNKGTVLGDLGKYNEAIKCYDKAIKINPNYVEAWYNKGIALGNLGKYEEAIKCYDEAIKINPNLAEAWSNKGVALGDLGKYDEAIKCYDEAIKINPNLAEAWFNKGIALGNLGKYDEAIKCYDEVIKINPNLAEAYGSLGITFLNLHKYGDAKSKLKRAEEIFSKKGATKDANKARKYELLAKNASELMSMLGPLDEQFTSCLNSRSLTELKENSLKISKDIKSVLKKFKKRKIPKDAVRLLISKEICFTAISNTLEFEKVDLKKLRDTEDIFEKWGLRTLAMAVGSLIVFIRGISKYSSLKEIPKEVEDYLLQFLKATNVLDGTLTKEITKGKPFATKPTAIEKKPEIKYIPLPDIEKDCLRICLVQLDILLTEKFPYRLIEEGKTEEKILKALEIAKQQDVDIICFPELSFAKEFVSKVKEYKEMIIIGGSFYDENFNKCPVIVNGEEYPVYKINPSPYWESEIAPGKGMKPGKDIKIFGTKDGKFRFGVLICIDYLVESYRLYQYQNNGKKGVNFIFNPSFTPDSQRFQRRADSDCENYYVDLMLTNVKKYGGTCIIGVEHKDVIQRLINEGYRGDNDIRYKLCEATNETMIIADLGLRSVEVPTALGARPRIKIIGRYRYRNGIWEEE